MNVYGHEYIENTYEDNDFLADWTGLWKQKAVSWPLDVFTISLNVGYVHL